jgi:hypothetical protein
MANVTYSTVHFAQIAFRMDMNETLLCTEIRALDPSLRIGK